MLTGDGEDGHRAAFLTGDATEGGAEGRLRARQGRRRHAQPARQAVRAQALAATSEGFATRDRGVRAAPEPGHEVAFGRAGGQFGADLGEDGQRRARGSY